MWLINSFVVRLGSGRLTARRALPIPMMANGGTMNWMRRLTVIRALLQSIMVSRLRTNAHQAPNPDPMSSCGQIQISSPISTTWSRMSIEMLKGQAIQGNIIPPPGWRDSPVYRAALHNGVAYRDGSGRLVVSFRSWITIHNEEPVFEHRDFWCQTPTPCTVGWACQACVERPHSSIFHSTSTFGASYAHGWSSWSTRHSLVTSFGWSETTSHKPFEPGADCGSTNLSYWSQQSTMDATFDAPCHWYCFGLAENGNPVLATSTPCANAGAGKEVDESLPPKGYLSRTLPAGLVGHEAPVGTTTLLPSWRRWPESAAGISQHRTSFQLQQKATMMWIVLRWPPVGFKTNHPPEGSLRSLMERMLHHQDHTNYLQGYQTTLLLEPSCWTETFWQLME